MRGVHCVELAKQDTSIRGVGVGASGGGVAVGCTQQQPSGGFIGMGFDFATGIRYRQHASGLVCHRGCRVVATIRSGLNHPACGVTASGYGRYSGVIRLRER